MNIDHSCDFIPLGKEKLVMSPIDGDYSRCRGSAQCDYTPRLPPPTCLRPNLLTRTKTFQRGNTVFNCRRNIKSCLSVDDLTRTSEASSSLSNQQNDAGSHFHETKMLKTVFKHDVLREPFRNFLSSQFCAENLDFWVAAEVYRTICKKYKLSTEQRLPLAVHIFDKFFSTESNEAVNVESNTRKAIERAVTDRTSPSEMFVVAQEQIFHLLKFDCWPRFLKNGGVKPCSSLEQFEEEETIDFSSHDLFRILSSTCDSTEISGTSAQPPKLGKSKSVIWRIGRKASSFLPKKDVEVGTTRWRRSNCKTSMCGDNTIKEVGATEIKRRKRLSILSAFSIFSNEEPHPVNDTLLL